MHDLYGQIVDGVLAFGPDVRSHFTTRNRVFSAGRVFAEFQSRKVGIRVLVRVDSAHVQQLLGMTGGRIVVKQVPDSHNWTLNQRVLISEHAEVPDLLELLHASYRSVGSKNFR